MDKRILIMLTILLTLLVSGPSHAGEEVPKKTWQGLQIKNALHAEGRKLTKNLSLRGTLAHLVGPKQKINAFFGYFGPKIHLGDSFWISPQLGFSTGFLGSEWAMSSLWMKWRNARKRLSIFAEGDVYFSPTDLKSYTYASVDFTPIPTVTLAAHTEGVMKSFTVGPRVDWHVANKLTLGLHTFIHPVNGELTVRLVAQMIAF